ncbi:MAG TPA: MFS transporter [Mycobacteriales bacterium]|nr:MFS transporter [Mycobacteriales bacterium]
MSPAPAAERAPAFVRDGTTLLLYASLGVFGCLQVVPGLVTPALRADLGYGYTLASLHVTAFAGLGVLAGLAAPVLDRRLGRRAVLLLGLLGIAGATAALSAGRTPLATLAAAGVAGLLGTLVIVTVQAGLSDHHGERRAVAFAESNVVASVGATAAPLVVGLAAGVLGSWRWGVLALAASGLLVALGARGRTVPVRVVPVDDSGAPTGLPALARIGVGLVFAGVVLEWTVSYWGATYLREVVALEEATAVTAMAFFFGAMLAGRVAGGVLVRRRDPAGVVAAGLVLSAAGLALHAVSTSAPVALSALLLLGLGISVLFPLGLALAVAGAPDRAALVSGRCVVAGSSAVLLGPLVVGQLADLGGLRAALAVLPLVVAAAAGLLAAYGRLRYRRNTPTSVRSA